MRQWIEDQPNKTGLVVEFETYFEGLTIAQKAVRDAYK